MTGTRTRCSSPQGTELYDTEGIAYVGGGKFVLSEERDRRVNLFTYVPGATLTYNGPVRWHSRDMPDCEPLLIGPA